MKTLKKLLVVVMALAMVFAMTVTAFAADLSTEEKALLDKIKAGVEVNGTTIKVPDDYVTQAQNYFASTDLTAAQVAVLDKAVDNVETAVKTSGVKSFNEMIKTPALNSKVVDEIKAANTEAGLGLTVTAGDDKITIKTADGNQVFADTTTNHTGSDYRAIAIAGVVVVAVLAACGIIISKKKLHNASAEA